MNRKQTLGQSIFSGLQKGLHVGGKIVELGGLAKSIYEGSKQLYSFGQTVAPMIQAVL